MAGIYFDIIVVKTKLLKVSGRYIPKAEFVRRESRTPDNWST